MKRFAKTKISRAPSDFDSYIPSGSPRGHSRPVIQAQNPAKNCQENLPTLLVSNPSKEASAPEPAAAPDLVVPPSPENPPARDSKDSPEPVSQAERVAHPSLATGHSCPSGKRAPLTTESSHHNRLCTVCSHPLRDAIEADFLRWRSPEKITREFHLGNRSTIYRHANAVGLFRRRKEQFGRVLEFILEQAETCSLEDANVVIRAARIYAHLDHNGKWVESPRTNYIYHAPVHTERSECAPLPHENPQAPDAAFTQSQENKNQKAKKKLIATRVH